MIVDGRLKDGDKALIECEKSVYCEGCNKVGMRHCAHADTCDYPIEFTKIKLNPHITIYPVEEDIVTKIFNWLHEKDYLSDEVEVIKKEWFEQNVK